MAVKRDCGKFTLSLRITTGLHRTSRKDFLPDPKLVDRAAKALDKIREKYEQKMMDEWGKAIGWDQEAADEAAAAAKADRQALLGADKKGREEKRAKRVAARV